MQPTCDGRQVLRISQENASSRPTNPRSIAGRHAYLSEIPSAPRQGSHDTYPRPSCTPRAEHGDQSSTLHVPDHPATHPWTDHNTFPVNMPMSLARSGTVPEPDDRSLSYQQSQDLGLMPYGQELALHLAHPHRPTAPFVVSHLGGEPGYNGFAETLQGPSNYASGHYVMNNSQLSLPLPFDQPVPHSNMTYPATHRSQTPAPSHLQPTFLPVGFQPGQLQHGDAATQNYMQEDLPAFSNRLHPPTQSEPMTDTITSLHPTLASGSGSSAHQINEPQDGIPLGILRGSLFCAVCGKGPFKRAHERRRHENSVHTNSQWQCELCGNWFSRKDILNRHKRQHALELPVRRG